MKFLPRIIVVVVVLSAALLAQTALMAYLNAPGQIPPGELKAPLANVPDALGDWVLAGESKELDESVRYQDPVEFLQRAYMHKKTRQVVVLWAIFSPVGEDRGHHPDVCLPVHGKTEDPTCRAHVDAEGHRKPIQQLRYGNGDDMTLVYYWHYTIPSAMKTELDPLQEFYHAQKQRAASITLELFADEKWPNTAEGAIDFVRLVDAAIQPIVGPEAVRGHDRAPVVLN